MRACPGRNLFVVLVVAFGPSVVVGGCGRNIPPGNPSRSTARSPAESVRPSPGEGNRPSSFITTPDDWNAPVGSPLFPPADPPRFPPPPVPGTDPVVIPNCTVQYEDRQIVSAEVDGKIDLIATPMKQRPDGLWEYRLFDGTVVTHDPARFDPKNPHPRVEFNPREKERLSPDKWVPYYKLRDGDVVTAGQVLCMLDDSLITTRMNGALKVKDSSAEVVKAAQQGLKFTDEKIELTLKASGALAVVERLNDQITRSRFAENLAQSYQSIAKAEAEYEEARVLLSRHWIRSRVDGIIRNVAKRSGEYVHAGEKIFEIQSTEKVRLEGNLDVQYYDRVKRNMVVTVEPALPSAPRKSHADHRQEVTGVAVTGHPTRPLIVSVGLDRKALVWDPNLTNEPGRPLFPHQLPHPVGIRSVACTPPGSPSVLAITGGEDGRVRVWDLTDPNKIPTTPAREPAESHTSPVTAVAVSPDGRFAATAAGREIFIWDLSTGKRLYSLPPEHRDTVTSLAFTPQALLVSASKDRTLKAWKVGAGEAKVAKTLDHRSGVLDTLGVSPDGGRVLFDQDKGRIDLVSLSPDAPTIGQLVNSGPTTAFATVALFAPDGYAQNATADNPLYTLVTAGGEGDLKGALQLWQAPQAGGRGSEIARLITPGRATVTCAAFSPHKDHRFLVVGTAAGTVHVWTPPAVPARKLEGRITNIDSTDPRYVTVRVEMGNKELGLLDRSAATVIVQPGQ
jgi:WD40 repeat protein